MDGHKKLVFIRWVDSHYVPQWIRQEDIPKETLVCESIGWLIEDRPDEKVIAAHITLEADPQLAGVMTIPKRSIIEERRVIPSSLN